MNTGFLLNFTTLLGLLCACSAGAQTYSVVHSFGALTNLTGFHPHAPLVRGPDGTLYGTASEGEARLGVYGTVFSVQSDGTRFTVLKYFTNYSEAVQPYGGLALSGSTLYGTTYGGGYGTVFKLNTDGSGFAVLKAFNYFDGANPYAGLTLSGTTLYGTTWSGGDFGSGTIFKLEIGGEGFEVLRSLDLADGVGPYSGLVVAGSTLYGTASSFGSSRNGTVFKLNTDGSGFTVLKNFTGLNDGGEPHAGLTLSGTTLYGTTTRGGSNRWGTVFKVGIDGGGFTVLKHFTGGAGGQYPNGVLALSGATLYGTAQGGSAGLGLVFRVNTDGSAFSLLKEFSTAAEGANPYAGVVLSGSTLYGTMREGGSAGGGGTVFKVNTDGGGFAVLKRFTVSRDGMSPEAGLLLSGGTLYGTTLSGVASEHGTVFKVNEDGSGFTTLHSFGGTNGASPRAGLVLSGETLYGTTSLGGNAGAGTVFMISTNGSGFTTLKQFVSGNDGASPYAGLVLSGSTLYGTTREGGQPGNAGTVFKLNTNGGGYAVLKTFTGGDDGAFPEGSLALSGSTLFGTTTSGGSVSGGTVFKINTNGTGFMVIKDFTGSDGSMPQAGLIVSGQTLYGTTSSGGGYGYGTVFKVNIDGSEFAVLKEFDGANDGAQPDARLVLSGNTLYGTATYGGAADLGTAFRLNTDGSAFAVLQHFTGAEGSWPGGGLVLAGARLFGTTSAGGALDAGVLFSLSLQPSLRVTRPTASTIRLAWPYPSDGFSLQQNANLGGMEWTSVTTPPAHVGDEWQVDLSSPPGHRFYRLRKP